MKGKIITALCAGLAFSVVSLAGVRTVNPGDDLYRAIKKASASDTLYLAPGNHALESAVRLDKQVTLIGSEVGNTSLQVYVFRLGEKAGSFGLKNLNITLTGRYLIDTQDDTDLDVASISFDGCCIDLGGETGACLINSRTAGVEVNRIGEIRLENTIVVNGGYPRHFLYTGAGESSTTVDRFLISDCTFAGMSRGLIFSAAKMNTSVEIDNCTFFAINKSDNNSGFIRLANAEADVKISDSVFNFAGPNTKFIVTGNKEAEISNSYFAGEYPEFLLSYGMKNMGEANDVFKKPSENLDNARTSFHIKIVVPGGGELGDPRWKNN